MSIYKKTRKIYHKQHSNISKDKKNFDRIYGIYKDQDFGLGEEYFNNKIVLDAGCGNFGALTLRLSRLKCGKIYACDIGKDWISALKKSLKQRGVHTFSNIQMESGNIMKLKYDNDYFDFVAVNGVFPNLKNLNEVKKSFKECARTVKKNGYYFTSFGVAGGLIQGVILPAVRNYYKVNKNFKNFIDGLNANNISKIINFISKHSILNNGPKINTTMLKDLLSNDFCAFLHNHIQAPYWLTNESTPKFVEALYKANGFKEVRRIKKFVKRSDIRKFFAPLHYERDYNISKILYGEGYVQYIGKKN